MLLGSSESRLWAYLPYYVYPLNNERTSFSRLIADTLRNLYLMRAAL